MATVKQTKDVQISRLQDEAIRRNQEIERLRGELARHEQEVERLRERAKVRHAELDESIAAEKAARSDTLRVRKIAQRYLGVIARSGERFAAAQFQLIGPVPNIQDASMLLKSGWNDTKASLVESEMRDVLKDEWSLSSQGLLLVGMGLVGIFAATMMTKKP